MAAKKELRVYFNLDNESDRELYEHLMKRTSASGYLKDIALDYLDNARGRNTAIVEQLKNINDTLSNISFNNIGQGLDKSPTDNKDSHEITNIDMASIDVNNIDFSDIKLD